MSLLAQVGDRLRGAARELPVEELTAAIDRLRTAADLLGRARRHAGGTGTLPVLTDVVEHLEHAVRAMLVAREEVDAYLAAVGLAGGSEATPPPRAERDAPPPREQPPPQPTARTAPAPLGDWWSARVNALTGGDPGSARPDRGDGAGDSAAPDSAALLRRIAGIADRSRLRTELLRADPATGLGMSAHAPAALRRLAGELLGRPARVEDLDTLVAATRSGLNRLLPGLPPQVGPILLGRACHAPARRRDAAAPHRNAAAPHRDATSPDGADSAVAGAVLTGLLLRRTGRSAPVPQRPPVAASPRPAAAAPQRPPTRSPDSPGRLRV